MIIYIHSEIINLVNCDFENRNFKINKIFVENRIKVQQISCGYKHCCIKGNNKAYSFGCNSNGQLGKGNFKNMVVPFFNDIKFSKLKNNINLKHEIIDIKISGKNAILLNENGEIIFYHVYMKMKFINLHFK